MDGEFPINIEQITPLSGVVAGGIGVTIFGSGFQKDALVYFGSQLAEKTVVESDTIIETIVPSATQPGTFAVTVVNPDNSQAIQNVGFVYISPENADRAEVFGISPLTIIEETETEIVLHGRNLIEAYENGLVALRCPGRLNLEISKVTTGGPDESGIETLTYDLIVTATPALGPLERIAIQVLASRRPESKDDLIVESSKQMFVVLPQDVPVTIAQTPSLSLDKPTMVVVLGRNLDGCTLEFADGIKPHIQKSDEDSLYGLITISKEYDGKAQTTFSILDNQGNSIGNYNLSVAHSSELKQSDPLPSYSEPGPVAGYTADLIEVPNQQFLGPTTQDAKVFDLKGELQNNLSLNSANIGVITYSYRYRFVIFNRVYLFPLFDGGEDVLGSEILAQVGKLFRLRGSGILFAGRIEVTIIIIIIVIITIDFPWLYGGFNEFPDQFPNAIGTIIGGWDIDFEIILVISFLNALVLPDGRLRVLFAIGLTIGIHFNISSDGFRLSFIRNFTHFVRYNNILPFPEQFPCSGRFQLADDNGQTVFIDQYGGRRSYYFPRLAGECCVPWSFNLELVRVGTSGNQETEQPPFNAAYCLNAAAPTEIRRAYIWSEPAPTGTPLILEMDLGTSAELVVLAEPVDENGNPTGQAVDIRTLDHGVRFYLDQPLEVLDEDTLPDGHAQSIEEGENIIKAEVTSVRVLDDDTEVPAEFSFFPGSIVAFSILRFLAQGESPRVEPQGLPVSVSLNVPAADYTVTPKLAYKKMVGSGFELEHINEIERFEPHETPREYVLAAMIQGPNNRTSDITITFPTVTFAMKSGTGNKPLKLPDTSQFPEGRGNIIDPKMFFSGNLVNQAQLTLNIRQSDTLPKLIAFTNGNLFPNLFEEVISNTTTLSKVVPPGKKVTGSETKFNIKLSNNPTINTAGTVAVTRTDFDFAVQNEETYEEYFRVFYKIRAILHRTSPTPPARLIALANFASNFHTDLISYDFNNLIIKGEDLWTKGYEYVRMDEKDDRPLYYARLEAIAVLRAYQWRKPSHPSLPVEELNKFEWASRGFETVNGRTAKIKLDSTTDRKIIVTGFDPFQLYLDPIVSNTSGIAALALHKNFPDAKVSSAIFPVRYRDFDNQFIEMIMQDGVKESSLIMTCSWTPNDYFNIDRFASGYRGGSLDNEYKVSNNNNPTGGSLTYIETTLPYESPNIFFNSLGQLNQQLTGGDYLVLDQSYSQSSPAGSASNPQHGQTNSYEKSSNVPSLNGVVEGGSGGSYLSNEIFYRTAKVRKEKQSGLSTGHFHIRQLSFSPTDYPTIPAGVPRTMTGDQIFSSVKDALTRFINALKQLVFSDTKVRSERMASIILNNASSTPVEITAGNFISDSPAFQLTTALPVTIAAGANKSFEFKFLPVDAKNYTDTVQLKNSMGKVLFYVQTQGKGIDPLVSIPPNITFPDTVINMENLIAIRIKNLTANQPIIVKTSTVNAPFSLQTALPVTIVQGAEAVLNLKFKPTAIGNAMDQLTLKDDDGNILLSISLSGNGIAQPPSPRIISFSPTSGYAGDPIMVTGENFIDVIEVRMRNNIVYHEIPLSSTQIEINAGSIGGKIKIKTAYGEFESTSVFFVRPIRNPPED